MGIRHKLLQFKPHRSRCSPCYWIRKFNFGDLLRRISVGQPAMQHHSSSVSFFTFCRLLPLRRFASFVICISVIFLVYQWFFTSLHNSVITALLPKRSSIILPNYRAHGISCRALFANHKQQHDRAQELMRTYKGRAEPDSSFLNIACASFIARRSYVTSSMSDEEQSFPIAYSMMVFKDLSQVERLFRAIYRPQNSYCFHVDKKSPHSFREGVKRLASCFSNVFVAPRSVNVRWATWTVLEADLICIKELLLRNKKWKYLINLTGQEFPLRTNLELVRILRALNGSNAMEGTVKHMNPDRIPSKRPYDVRWTKGSVHIVAKRAFFEFLFSSRKVTTLMELLRPMPFVDETLFSTLNHNPQLGTPGAYLGEPETGPNYPFLPRFKNWGTYPCLSRKVVRAICIWGARDLPNINPRTELFINKLYWNFQPLALDCLEERHWNHTRRDYGDHAATNDPPINITHYSSLLVTKLHQ